MKTILFGNIKGGTGKTTTVFEVGYCLTKYHKKKVLMIDLDAQCNLSGVTGADINGHKTVYDYLTASATLDEAVMEVRNNLFLMVGSRKMLSQNFVGIDDIYLLKEAMEYIKNSEYGFDYILIDNGPEPGNLMKMALLSSDGVVLVSHPNDLSYTGGIQMCVDIKAGRKYYNGFNVKPLGIVINCYRPTVSAEINLEKFESLEPEFAKMFKTKIRFSVTADDAKELREAINEYKPKSPMALEYQALTKEILERIKKDGK